MAYTKQTWSTGETITADKLNHIEDGIANSEGSSVLFLNESNEGVLDKTFREIYTAMAAGKIAVIRKTMEDWNFINNYIYETGYNPHANKYMVATRYMGEDIEYNADTLDDYPVVVIFNAPIL